MRIYFDAKKKPSEDFTLTVRTPDEFKSLFKKWHSHITYVSFEVSEDSEDLARWLINMTRIHQDFRVLMKYGFHDNVGFVKTAALRKILGLQWVESYGRSKSF